jgi:hypothetical protein
MRHLLMAAALCAVLASPSLAQQVPNTAYDKNGIHMQTVPSVVINPNNGSPCAVGNAGCPALGSGGPYALLSNATTSGSPVGPVAGAAYEWCTTGTFGGASLQLQALGPDGVNYMNVGSAITSAGCTGVVIGQNATVKVTVTGGSPAALYSSLS